MRKINTFPLENEKLEKLRAALIAGENSGTSTSLDIEAFIASKRQDPLQK